MDRSVFLQTIGSPGGTQARDTRRSALQAVPSAQSKRVTNPGDLVALALTILNEDKVTSDETQSPQGAGIASEFGIKPVDLSLQRHVLSDGTECLLPIRYFDVQCLV